MFWKRLGQALSGHWEEPEPKIDIATERLILAALNYHEAHRNPTSGVLMLETHTFLMKVADEYLEREALGYEETTWPTTGTSTSEPS